MKRLRHENVESENSVAGAAGSAVFQSVVADQDQQPALAEQRFAAWRNALESRMVRQTRNEVAMFNLVCENMAVTLIINTLLRIRIIPTKACMILLGCQAVVMLIMSFGSLVAREEEKRKPAANVEPGAKLVNLVLLKHLIPYAYESGSLSFYGDFLIFQGDNTTFSFSREAVIVAPKSGALNRFWDIIRLGEPQGLQLSYNADGIAYDLHLVPEARDPEFERKWDQWVHSTTGAAGLSVFAPKESTESALKVMHLRIKRCLLATICAGCVVAAGFAYQWSRPSGSPSGPLVFSPSPVFLLTFIAPGLVILLGARHQFLRARKAISVLARELT